MDTWQALYQLSTASGPPGYEGELADIAARLWRPYVDEVFTDALGNVIAHRKPSVAGPNPAPAIMLATHIDEVSLIVSYIEDSGFLRVYPLGGADLRVVNGQEVLVHGKERLAGIIGVLPATLRRTSDRDKAPQWDELFIDVGLPGDVVKEQVGVGDLVTFAPPCLRLQNNRACGKAFDNRASVAAVFTALQRLHELTQALHLYAVATVQEEVGTRGAITSTFGISPQAAIAIDVGFGAMPGVDERDTLVLGKGPGITLGANIHRGMRQRLIDIAEQEGIAWQTEIAPGSSGTDAWGMQVSQAGVPTAVISLPLRYMHSPVETADLADLQSTARLLSAFIANLQPAEVWGWANGSM